MRSQKTPTLLLVANYKPDVGYAWWLMENFWVQASDVARRNDVAPLLVYPKDGPLPEAITAANIATHVLPFPGTGLRDLLTSLKLVRAQRVKAVYFTDRGFTNFKYLLFRAAGVRVILNHDHTPGDRPGVGGLKGALKALYRRIPPLSCNLQICVSDLVKQRAIANARIPAERTVVVQNGIEPLRCENDGYAHRVFNIPHHRLICMTVSRAHPYKRIDFVIETARRCRRDHGLEDITFVHCGDGPDMDRLRMLVEEADLEPTFILAGRRSDIRELLCSADVALHPAEGEAFSLSILEYMSAGLAVLVPNTPSVSQAIDHQRTGLIYPRDEPDQAAQMIAKLRRDEALRKRLGAAAAQKVRDSYSLDGMNESFRAVLDNALRPL